MAKENLVSKISNKWKNTAGLVRKTVRNTARNAILLTAAGVAAIGGYNATARADTFNVYDTNDVQEINQVIKNANNGMIDPNNPKLRDTINFESGIYELKILGPNKWEFYNFLPNRNYDFNVKGVTMWGHSGEHENLIKIINGGNMDISGNLIVGNSKRGIWVGNQETLEPPYKNINISGLSFTAIDEEGDSISLVNIKHSSPLTEAAVKVSHCTADSGNKFISRGTGTFDANSPYASVENCTLSNLNLHLGGGVIDVPIFCGNLGWIALGNDEIKDNILINCSSLSKPADFWVYHSPENIAQSPSTINPLITGVTYPAPPHGEEHPYTGEKCYIYDQNDFVLGTIIPRRDRSLNLGGGRYIGAIEPHHDLPGNLNFDEFVDFRDYVIAANRYKGNLDEIIDVTNDWLVEEPNDSDGNLKL